MHAFQLPSSSKFLTSVSLLALALTVPFTAQTVQAKTAQQESKEQNDYFWNCLNQVELTARDKTLELWSHSDYRVKTLDELARRDRNRWGEVMGGVTGYEREGQYLWLILDEKFYVGIPRAESGKFSNILTPNLLESRVIVRGSLYYSYKKWQLISRHPSQIS